MELSAASILNLCDEEDSTDHCKKKEIYFFAEQLKLTKSLKVHQCSMKMMQDAM